MSLKHVSNEELVDRWVKGNEYIIDIFQSDNDPTKSNNGEPYDPDKFGRAILKMNLIEDELISRGVRYGK